MEAAEIDYRNAKSQKDYVLQLVRQQTMDMLKRISVAQSRNEVLQKSVAVAQQIYDISLQRFRNGTVNRNDLAQAQQRLKKTFAATMARAKRYDAQGNGLGCTRELAKAKRMYIL